MFWQQWCLTNAMSKPRLNQILAIAPVVLSAFALSLVVMSLVAGWERKLKDEGAAAHTFQLLIVSQVPIVFTYLMTANWTRWRKVVGHLVLQGAAILVAHGASLIFQNVMASGSTHTEADKQ